MITINADKSIDIHIEPSHGQEAPAGVDLFITEVDVKILLDQAYSMESWILAAVVGKVNHAKKIMVRQHSATYMSDPSVNNDDDIITAVMSEADYKNAKTRIDEATA